MKLDTRGLITDEEKTNSRKNNVQNMYNVPEPTKVNRKSKNKSNQPNPINPVDSNPNNNNNNSSNKVVNGNQLSCEQLTVIANQSIINGKHPVNVLQEVCLKRKWKPPTYTIVSEDGPAHKKNFLIKCTLNKVEYLPSFSSPNKKLAKALASLVCLQSFGLINSDEMNI